MRVAVFVTFGLLLAVASAMANEPYYYWPAAPVYPPYVPPMNYGPGNHYPHPFQRWYPEHPYAHLYYPYTYLPYSAYYSYPTINVYGKSYNPYAPPVPLRFPGMAPPLMGEVIQPGVEQLPNPPRPAVVEPGK